MRIPEHQSPDEDSLLIVFSYDEKNFERMALASLEQKGKRLGSVSERLEALRTDSCIRCPHSAQQSWIKINYSADQSFRTKFVHNFACINYVPIKIGAFDGSDTKIKTQDTGYASSAYKFSNFNAFLKRGKLYRNPVTNKAHIPIFFFRGSCNRKIIEIGRPKI